MAASCHGVTDAELEMSTDVKIQEHADGGCRQGNVDRFTLDCWSFIPVKMSNRRCISDSRRRATTSRKRLGQRSQLVRSF